MFGGGAVTCICCSVVCCCCSVVVGSVSVVLSSSIDFFSCPKVRTDPNLPTFPTKTLGGCFGGPLAPSPPDPSFEGLLSVLWCFFFLSFSLSFLSFFLFLLPSLSRSFSLESFESFDRDLERCFLLLLEDLPSSLSDSFRDFLDDFSLDLSLPLP